MFVLGILLIALLQAKALGRNSTFDNPILPGFHPDPSCIFVPERDDTFFCVSSSFVAFPGLPIHASTDLQEWKLVSNAFSRTNQLPELGSIVSIYGGVWGPTIRYRDGMFYVMSTLVLDDLPIEDEARWINFIITSTNPFNSSSWSDPIYFNFTGYDTSPFWDDDGQVYITGSHPWQILPGIDLVKINLQTGATANITNIWNGTGELSPEGPHLYKKDGYYYLMIAEGGTFQNQMETIARSRHIEGPYESNPANPVLTNANTTEIFQAVGHADLFKDWAGQWWAVALSFRVAPDLSSPMGRETVLTPVSWTSTWPIFSPVRGTMNGWRMPTLSPLRLGEGPFINAPDHINFAPNTPIPPHLVHYRTRNFNNYIVSPEGYPYSLQLISSVLNLSATDLDSPYWEAGQTYIGRRQVDSLFTFHVQIAAHIEKEGQEAGVTAFLNQGAHYDLGVILLPASTTGIRSHDNLIPHIRFRGFSTLIPPPETILVPIPDSWRNKPLTMQIRTCNFTTFEFLAGPANILSELKVIGYGQALGLSWTFTGTFLGTYATTNGGSVPFSAYVSDWTYVGQGQMISGTVDFNETLG